jgi:hypothetical protein
VVTLRDIEGWPPEEVCALFGITDGNQRVFCLTALARRCGVRWSATSRRRRADLPEVVNLVSDYLDGQLDPEQRRMFEEHVAVCPPRRGYVTQLSETKQQLGRLRQDDLPEHVQEDLLRVFRGLDLLE